VSEDLLYRSGCRQMKLCAGKRLAATLARIKKKVKLPRLEQSLAGAFRTA